MRYFGRPMSDDSTALNSNTFKVSYITVTSHRYIVETYSGCFLL